MKRLALLLLMIVTFMGIAIVYSCSQKKQEKQQLSTASLPADHQFVGDQKCISCHQKEATGWHGSDHDMAMKKATKSSVRGDFNDATFKYGGHTYRFFKEGNRYMVHAPGPDGNMNDYQISYTFGWEPLQQYLIDYGKGKYQVLRVSWDTKKKKWFYMDAGHESNRELQSDKWMRWTGGAMNWNTMCSNCHSTNVSENYIASADSFHTTWSSINVSCESCHGPGKKHVRLMNSNKADEVSIKRIREDLRLTENVSQKALIQQCAQCHSLREGITDDYNHEGDYFDHYHPSLPHPPSYFADGQIKGEDYVYASFLQSRMFRNGVKCNDCHDPHTLKLKANVTDNSLCLTCHDSHYNSPKHTFHKLNTKASECVNCHMPGRYYMEVDFRRDHSFRVPRPDLSQKFGSPNACNNCHNEKSNQWAADAINRWYGDHQDQAYHYSDVFVKADSTLKKALPALRKLVSDSSVSNIVRATSLWYLGQSRDQQSIDVLKNALHDSSVLVRNRAVRSLGNMNQAVDKPSVLASSLDDSLRSVRLGAAQGLAEFTAADVSFGSKKVFKKAMKEYKKYLDEKQYFPQGQMNRAQFFEKQGKTQKAIQAYKKTLKRDPHFNQARINLAYIYNRQGKNQKAEKMFRTVIKQQPDFGPAYYSLALLLAQEKRMQGALKALRKASELMPDNPRVFYNLAISYQQLKKPELSEKAYLSAINLAPDNPDFLYGIATLYLQQQEFQKAKKYAQKITNVQPGNQRAQRLLRLIRNRVR